MNKRTKKAFTLIELLVVVAIIGILAATGTTSYVRALKNGRDARRKSDVDDIASALNMYWTENNGSLPSNLSDAKTKLVPSSGDKYLNAWPTETVSGYAYSYTRATSTAGAMTYVVCAKMELAAINGNSTGTNGAACTLGSTNCTHFCKKGP